MILGSFCSFLIGGIIGLNIKQQSSAGLIATLVSLVLGVTNFFSNYFDTLKSFLSLLYSQHITRLLSSTRFLVLVDL